MALSLAYINEVLNQLPCTVVMDEQTWPQLLTALKFEGRKLEDQVLGRMRLRWAPGGYEGLLQRMETLTQQREALQKDVETLTQQLEEATAPHARVVEATATA